MRLIDPQTNDINPIDLYVGQRIRERRQRLGWTLMDLARRLRVSHQQVQKYEQGVTRVSASVLYQLSRIFQTNQDYFFIGIEKISPSALTFSDSDTIDLTPKKNLNIVAIEDDAADELLLRKAIEASDIEVNLHTLHDGEAAMQFLRHPDPQQHFPRPDIILLDLNIPKRDGHMILKDLKRDRTLQDIPIIVMTNSLSKKEMLDVYRQGASGYVCKSFDFDIFRTHVHKVINYWADTVVLPNKC